MEKYKARGNSDVNQEVPEKSEKEKKQESTEKAVDLAAETALDYFTGGMGSTVKNAIGNVPIVGNKVNKTWDKTVKGVSKVVSKTPAGDVLKKADDAGVTDLARTAKDTVDFTKGKGGTGSVKPTNMEGIQNNSNIANKSSKFEGLKSGINKTTSTNGDIVGNLWGKMPKGLKIKIIAGCGICFLLLLICFTVFAQDDIQNLSLTNNTTLSNGGSSRRKCTTEEIANNLIYVGDSRIVGLKAAVENDNITYIAESSKGLDWLKNTASIELDNVLQGQANSVVVLALGVNDLYNIDNYVNYYKELIAKYSDINFYILSVNPVDESKTSANGYSVTNADIEVFNKTMADNFSNNYIDTYSSLSNIGTSDGLHYDNETYKTLNNLVASNISSSGKIMCGGGDLSKSLEEISNWYITDVAVYDQSLYLQSPFTTSKVRADCTGFAVAFMSYVAGVDIPISWSGEMVYPDGSWAQNVATYGWKVYSSDEIGELQFGDVLVAHSGALYSTKGEHAEIYVDESHTFGWGSVQTTYPKSNTITKSTSGGHVHFMDSGHDYITIYRYEGAINNDSGSSSSGALNATKMNDSSFNHGTKPKSNQKYIMLHDTEMSASASSVVESWKNSGNGVAAHFVVDKDGTIIQAVDLDVITHHAGPGGPGNYDEKFGVGNNDGKGNGDDLVGNPTGIGNYANYTSYGMNSYSIGIEMCHVNGETYPEAQLEAVDKIIAYIDSYYGFESTIIDHKEWRPSNSDTDTNFATYLNNYKTLRHH